MSGPAAQRGEEDFLRLIGEIRRRAPDGDEYHVELRRGYGDLLEYVRQNGDGSLDLIVKFWWAAARWRRDPATPNRRDVLTPGSYIDLWSLYRERFGRSDGEKYRTERLLRDFVAGLDPVVESFVRFKDPSAEKWLLGQGWLAAIGELFRRPAAGGTPSFTETGRLGVGDDAVALYLELFGQKRSSWLEVLRGQVAAARAAIECRLPESAALLQPGDASAPSIEREAQALMFAQIAALIAAHARDDIGEVRQFASLNELAGKLTESLNRAAPEAQRTEPSMIERLLRYWAADFPSFELFLKRRCKFAFRELSAGGAKPSLPADIGSDLCVAVLTSRPARADGASATERSTAFLFASEAASVGSNGHEPFMPLLNAEHPDAAELTRLRGAWKDGKPIGPPDPGLHLRSSMHGLQRLYCFEREEPDSLNAAATSEIVDFFKTRCPAAVVLMVDAAGDDGAGLGEAVRTALRESKTSADVPIYVVIDRADVPAPGEDASRRLAFESRLNAGEALALATPFVTNRYTAGKASKASEFLGIVSDMRQMARDLAFADLVSRDINRLTPLLDRLLSADGGAGFTNITVAYARCTADQGSSKVLRALWHDLATVLGAATLNARQQFYRTKFQQRLDEDFKAVDKLSEEPLEQTFDAEIDAENAGKGFAENRGVADYQGLKERLGRRQSSANVRESLKELSGFATLATKADRIVQAGNRYADGLNRIIRSLLLELGVPEEINWSSQFESGSTSARTAAFGATADRDALLTAIKAAFETSAPGSPPSDGELTVIVSAVEAARSATPIDSLTRTAATPVIFDLLGGNRNTLCLFRDVPLSAEDAAAIGALRPRVHEAVAAAAPHNAERILLVMAGYSPRYHQLGYSARGNLDPHKAKALNDETVVPGRQDATRGLLAAILKAVAEYGRLDSKARGAEAIWRREQAIYLKGLLEKNGFDSAPLLEGPENAAAATRDALAALDEVWRHRRFLRRRRTAPPGAIEKYLKAMAKVIRQPPPRIDLVADARDKRDEVEVILLVARTVTDEIHRLHKEHGAAFQLEKWLNDPPETPAAMPIVDLKVEIVKYQQTAKQLLLSERIAYLRASGWLDGLVQRGSNPLPNWDLAGTVDIEARRKDFAKMIGALLAEPSYWRLPSRAEK